MQGPDMRNRRTLATFWPKDALAFNLIGIPVVGVVYFVVDRHNAAEAAVIPVLVGLALLGLLACAIRAPILRVYADHIEIRQFWRTMHCDRRDVVRFYADPQSRVMGGDAQSHSHVVVELNLPDPEVGMADREIPVYWCYRYVGAMPNEKADGMVDWLESWRKGLLPEVREIDSGRETPDGDDVVA